VNEGNLLGCDGVEAGGVKSKLRIAFQKSTQIEFFKSQN
jgi:hypothetical protein